jgi:uncharacterized membrane-anchored protein YhcB (DUF1043 family)
MKTSVHIKAHIPVLVAALVGTVLGFIAGVHTANHAKNKVSEQLALAEIKAALRDYQYRFEYDRDHHPDRYILEDPHHTK